MKNLFRFSFSIDWDDSDEKSAAMRTDNDSWQNCRSIKRPIIQLTAEDYRRLLRRKPKSEIVKIDVCDRNLDIVHKQLCEDLSRVQNPQEMLVSIEIPMAGKTFRTKDLRDLLNLLTEPFPASRPILTWGTAEVDTDQFRVVVYAA